MKRVEAETIAAIVTPPGRGAVAIIRISGPQVPALCQKLLGKKIAPRYAHYGPFLATDGSVIDQGIALYFPGPNSFTGEDVLELQGHGGAVISQILLQQILQNQVRLSRPGEFSERAFLNNKMDLAQAEAIADLIDASSSEAARAAMHSLTGEFSKLIHALVQEAIHLRMLIEAYFDFPEEEINFLENIDISQRLQQLLLRIEAITAQAKQGVLLQEGMTIVIAGKPNAGKSSLLNALSGRDSAIVTDIPGTTRDVLREQIHIDGVPLHIIDTAGLRQAQDTVEKMGIERAYQEIAKADHILWITEQEISKSQIKSELASLPKNIPVTIVRNKIDLLPEKAHINLTEPTSIAVSAKTNDGIELLKQHLLKSVGYQTTEGKFIARARHLEALNLAAQFLRRAQQQHNGELMAEDLRQVQLALNTITGEFTADDLLGKIFANFCIGK